MKKLYVSVINCKKILTGGGKAREDVRGILREEGFSPIFLGGNSGNRIIANIQLLFSIFALLFKIRRSDILFWQYPYIYNFRKLFQRILLIKKARYKIMIHDLDHLRGIRNIDNDEVKLLNRAETLIVNTKEMGEIVKNMIAVKNEIKITQIWDYLTDNVCSWQSKCGNSVVFAGTLSKSTFISSLDKVKGDLHFYIYGNGEIESTEKTTYMGAFASNDITDIKGDWGLVWDGERIDKCSGLYGDYLKINASHKNSLYLACEKPLIVWDKSAMSKFVKQYGIGLCVSSLNDIETAIAALSPEEKQNILKNVKIISPKIRDGYFLKKTLCSE